MKLPQNETITAAAPAPGIDSSSSSASFTEGALLTPEQMALRLNVSRRCVGNWARDGIIPMIKIGRVCRFDLSQVLAAVEKYAQAAAKR